MSKWLTIGMLALGTAGLLHAQPKELPESTIPGRAVVDAAEPALATPMTVIETFRPAPPMVWSSVDYLLWWSKGAPQPGPLAATGSIADMFPGALDQPGTRVLSGNKSIGFDPANGIRGRIGIWFGPDYFFGVELGGTLLEQVATGTTFAGDANGQPFIGRPFTNALTNNPNIFFVAQNFPNPALSASMTGRLDIITQSRFWAWDLNASLNLLSTTEASWVVLLGGKAAALDERLMIDESIRNLAPGGGAIYGGISSLPTQTVQIADDFRTTNRFFGGNVGSRFMGAFGQFAFDVSLACAFGVTQQEMTILGTTTLLNGSTPVTTLPGGVLAGPSNSGKFTRDVFSVMPEAGLNIGYRLTSWMTARVGYSFLYWSDVVRPTGQMDFLVNPNKVPSAGAYGTPGGPSRPAFTWNTRDYWVHGVNFGFDIRW